MYKLLELYRSKNDITKIAEEVASFLKQKFVCEYVSIFEVNLKDEYITELFSNKTIFNEKSFLGKDCFLFKFATNSRGVIFGINDKYHISGFKEITYKNNINISNGIIVQVLGINNNTIALLCILNKSKDFNEQDLNVAIEASDIFGVTLEALESHNRAISFLDSITHEILAPMAGVKNTSKFLIDYFDRQTNENISDKIKRTKLNLNEIYRSSQMSISLVQSITMFSRSIQMSNKDLKLVPCDLYDRIFKRCKQNIAPLALSRNFDPNRIKAINFQHWPKIKIDRQAFTQVITNLFNNAVKYAFDDPDSFVIEIEFNINHDGSANICVIDYGIGINEKSKERIFYPGVREEAAINKVPTGTGIGLSTVKRLLDLHGISISLENCSLPTKFVLNIPKELIIR